jgi:large subunit ribosomal protein L15
MMIHDITEIAGRDKARKRVGRGRGSGSGKTSGRGHKGASSRSGHADKRGYEGGQMPFLRRIPKRGFSNHPFRREFHIVNLKAIAQAFEAGASIDSAALAGKGLIPDTDRPVKILGEGDLTKAVTITVDRVSASARAKIEGCGGSIAILPRRKWTRQGIKELA